MKLLLTFFALLPIVASFAESPIAAQERIITRALSEMGYFQGYDIDTGAFVAVAHSSHRCDRGECTAKLWAIHKKTFHESLANARREIETMICGDINASNKLRRFRADGVSQKTSEADFSAETEQHRIGFETLAMHGEWIDGTYLVTTAVAWSERRERDAIASLSGEIEAAHDWENQLRSHLEKHTLETLPPYGSFTDSNGFVHFFGAYAVDVSSAATPLKRNILLKKMESRALANLHLASDATAVSVVGSSISLDSASDGETSSSKSLDGMVDKAAIGTMKPFRCVLEKDAECAVTGGNMRLVVYAYIPMRTATKTSPPSYNPLEPSPSTPPRIKLWNPITNTYVDGE